MQSCVLELVPSCDVVITLWTAVVSPKAPFAWAQLFSLCLFRALTTFFLDRLTFKECCSWLGTPESSTTTTTTTATTATTATTSTTTTTTAAAAAADCYLWLLPLTTYRWLLQALLCFYFCLNSVYISASQVHFKNFTKFRIMAVFIDNVNDGSATTSVWILQQIVERVWFWIVGPSAWIKIKSQDRCDAWNGLSDLLQSRTALGEKETVHLGNDGRQDRTQPCRQIEGYVFQLGRCQASGFGGPWRVLRWLPQR